MLLAESLTQPGALLSIARARSPLTAQQSKEVSIPMATSRGAKRGSQRDRSPLGPRCDEATDTHPTVSVRSLCLFPTETTDGWRGGRETTMGQGRGPHRREPGSSLAATWVAAVARGLFSAFCRYRCHFVIAAIAKR